MKNSKNVNLHLIPDITVLYKWPLNKYYVIPICIDPLICLYKPLKLLMFTLAPEAGS